MPQKYPFESSFIYGLHDVGGERFMLEAATPGWVCVSEPVGIDPADREGKDYTHLTRQGLSVMVRLNAGYSGVGTTPFEKYYDDFAQRCANFVQASGDVHIWIVGNEPNHPVEWPGADWDWGKAQPRTENSVGEKITPQRYVKVYLMVREAIHGLDGHENDLVLTAAIAPWNALCTYPGNATGDWVTYFRDVLDLLGPENCDGITLHTYTLVLIPNKLMLRIGCLRHFRIAVIIFGPIRTLWMLSLWRCSIYLFTSLKRTRMNPGEMKILIG